MADFPYPSRFHLPTITSVSRESAIVNQGGQGLYGARLTFASGGWPAANTAFAIPFQIWTPYLVQSVFWLNAATTAGNLDAGVYSADGQSLLFHAGSTAQSGASVPQAVAVGPYLLEPGTYFMALVASVITTPKIIFTTTPNTYSLQAVGCGQMASAGPPLPAALTLTTPSTFTLLLPVFGISSKVSTLV